jgi:FMN phosphatase YigB (HAD superfamily)/DNA-binding XRE family transcriptional regulator
MDEKGLGRRLQAMRVQAGLTQQMLCQEAGLSYSTLTKIERGAIKSPSIFTIQSIASALHVGLDELLGIPQVSGKGAASARRTTRSKSGITFAYFDINGCLVRFYHRAFTRLADETGASADAIETAFWHYNDQACRGEIGMEEFNRLLAEHIGLKKPLDWLAYYLDAVEPIVEMAKLVEWAAARYRVGLLSNIMPGFIEVMRARKLLPDVVFDTIIDSSEIGAIKPEVQIFEAAAQAAGCPASEILFVDDSRTNLMAAEKCGWHVLWFDDAEPTDSIRHVREALAE